MASGELRISLLASGDILLNGQASTLAALSTALNKADKSDVVAYYRENPAGPPSPISLQILGLITAAKLPLRLSTKPDFSDTVTAESALARAFASIRAKAAQGHIVVVRPDAKVLSLPAVKSNAVSSHAIASIEKILPSVTKRNVAVIADTSWAMTSSPDIKAANAAVPFFGMLIGFASIGHAVWVFQPGRMDMVMEGARNADLLIVDSKVAEALPPNWKDGVKQTMNSIQLLVHDRATFQLLKA